jgi:AcrR family transcriptional regulator
MTGIHKDPVAPGSPQWWLSRSHRDERPKGPGRPAASFDKIISTALEAIDAVGYQAFNMRMLAENLNSGTATLYRHVASKEEILIYVVDRMLGEIDLDDQALARLPWQEACTLAATAFYKVLSSHPKIVPALVTQIPVGPNGRKNRERLIAILLAGGFSPEMAACAYATMAHYVVGFAIQHSAADNAISKHHAELREAFSGLDATDYPATVRVARELAGISFDDQFLFGFQLIITGLVQAKKAGALTPGHSVSSSRPKTKPGAVVKRTRSAQSPGSYKHVPGRPRS